VIAKDRAGAFPRPDPSQVFSPLDRAGSALIESLRKRIVESLDKHNEFGLGLS
jgi:hypothetical protein